MKSFLIFAALLLLGPGIFGQSAPEAKKFLDDAGKKLFDLSLEAGQAGWIQSTYITDDTEAVAAKANERFIAEIGRAHV